MVTRAVTVAALGLLLSCAPAPAKQPGLDKDRWVADQITFSHNGARSDNVSGDETAAVCRQFRLTTAEVREFFSRSDAVDDRAFNHDLDMSRCYASGTIRFTNGSKGTWFIDRERRGSLKLTNGGMRYRYCLACASKKFGQLDPETRQDIKLLIQAAKSR